MKIAILLGRRRTLGTGGPEEGSSQACLQPQQQTSQRGPGQALEPFQVDQDAKMGLIHVLRQLPLPGNGCHRRSQSPDADSIGEGEPDQPFVANSLQRASQRLIILFGDPVGIIFQKFGFESAEHLTNHGELLHQRMTLP